MARRARSRRARITTASTRGAPWLSCHRIYKWCGAPIISSLHTRALLTTACARRVAARATLISLAAGAARGRTYAPYAFIKTKRRPRSAQSFSGARYRVLFLKITLVISAAFLGDMYRSLYICRRHLPPAFHSACTAL